MNFLQIASFGIYENFFMGIFHGILFSLPLSIPFLISLRYFLLKGLSFGFSSLFGILCGQLVFFVILCSGIRPLILLWYSVEPILAFVGVGLTFQLATDFYHQKKIFDISLADSAGNKGRLAFTPPLMSSPISTLGLQIFDRFGNFPLEKIKIFLFQFCLIFFNPVFPALSTRIILTQDILTHFSLLYTSGFFIGSILCVVSFLFFLQSFYFLFTRCKPLINSRIKSVLFSIDTFSQFVNNCFVFGIIGLILHGSFQYTWRFITHYPFEFFSIPIGIDSTSDSNARAQAQLRSAESMQSRGEAHATLIPTLDTKTLPYFREFLREFPTQDSNIRHREKTLPVERHLPIERINLRRNLSGRPPLNEEQKSDASTKYNSFFLNKIENIFENFKIRSRENTRVNLTQKTDVMTTSSVAGRSSAEAWGAAAHSRGEAYALQSVAAPTQGQSQRLHHPLQSPNSPEATMALQTNKAKGKPQFSYIRHLFYEQVTPDYIVGARVTGTKSISATPGLGSAAKAQAPNRDVSSHEIALNPYIHDDLSVYYALSKDGVAVTAKLSGS
jgi:hypothetical protein